MKLVRATDPGSIPMKRNITMAVPRKPITYLLLVLAALYSPFLESLSI